MGTVSPRDLISLSCRWRNLPELGALLHNAKSPLLSTISKKLDIMEDVRTLLEAAIQDEPPLTLKDGGVIRDGYHEEVDKLRRAMTEGKTWIAQAEAQEREETGIKNLRICI